MVLQQCSMGKSLHWQNITTILFNAKVGIFPPSYAVIPSFISCFTTFYCLNPYFIFKLILFNKLICSITGSLFGFCYSIQLYMCDCSIRVTAVLVSRGCVTILYFHCASIMNTARPIITECVIMIDC